ncbi:hypothetical protein CA13_27000 [Planctomycetes bacterium CA13]|uniref:Uncharacterized protein n=1 Tax=Novipirellula herctigrandis TaxID=2527986 RepID=A0A5C5Z1P8_9BACT|nr:hypothetical protein CA13_27000 [Planctomycetes bacterium CA13]
MVLNITLPPGTVIVVYGYRRSNRLHYLIRPTGAVRKIASTSGSQSAEPYAVVLSINDESLEPPNEVEGELRQ